jgi:signal recognition particle receptor subunit beta
MVPRVSHINPLAREISAKIVYYGPGLSGKTTSLKYLYSVIRPERRGDLVTLATEGDRTLFFDFLPISIERVQDMPVRLQIYTVPGQIFYAATRKLVLNGADGVVFVADSQEAARDSNRLSLQDLEENLADMGTDLARFPHVFQFNKRDLQGLMPVPAMNQEFNRHGAPYFETCASRGTNVLNALREITTLVVRDMKKRQPPPRKSTSVETPLVAEDGLAARITAAAAQEAELPPPPPAAPPSTTAAANVSMGPSIPPVPGFSFAALWPENAGPVQAVEQHLAQRAYTRAVREAAQALATLLEGLPGVPGSDGPMTRAALLGLDGREYLRLCRLASAPDAAITPTDGLFALYMLVGARLKQQSF